MKDRKLICLNLFIRFVSLTGFFCFFVMLFHIKSSAQMSLGEIEKRETLLEEQRINIEKDRQELNRDCSKVSSIDTTKRQECQKRYDDIMGRMKQYKADLGFLAKQKAALDKKSTKILQEKPLFKEQSHGKTFPTDLDDLKKVIKWSGSWTEKQKDGVVKALDGFKNKKIRDWTAANVKFELRTDPGQQGQLSPWMGESRLIFGDRFFSSEPYVTRVNLMAFEAGKVFWRSKKDNSFGENKTLEIWFKNDFNKKYPSLISDLRLVKYLNENLTDLKLGEIADDHTRFGTLFRAQALGLKWDTPKGQEAQREFKKYIDPFLKKRSKHEFIE